MTSPPHPLGARDRRGDEPGLLGPHDKPQRLRTALDVLKEAEGEIIEMRRLHDLLAQDHATLKAQLLNWGGRVINILIGAAAAVIAGLILYATGLRR